MITAHLTETEIQLYVAEPGAISREQATHVEGCTLCRAKAANYALLFNGIHDAEKPAFNFDLSALVMEQLPAPKSAFPWAAILVAIFSIALVAVSALFFSSAILELIGNASAVLLTVAAAGAVVVLAFLAIEMLKEHQTRMDALMTQKTLQL
jgi:hypothetical protein